MRIPAFGQNTEKFAAAYCADSGTGRLEKTFNLSIVKSVRNTRFRLNAKATFR